MKKIIITLILGPNPTRHFLEIVPFVWYLWPSFKTETLAGFKKQICINTYWEMYEGNKGSSTQYINLRHKRAWLLKFLFLRVGSTYWWTDPDVKKIYGEGYDKEKDTASASEQRYKELAETGFFA